MSFTACYATHSGNQEGPVEITQSNTSAQNGVSYSRLFRTLTNQVFNFFRDENFTATLSNLFQSLTTLTRKEHNYIHIITNYGSSTCPIPNGVQETAESHPDHKWNIQPQKGEPFAYLHRKDGYHLSLVGNHILKMRAIEQF